MAVLEIKGDTALVSPIRRRRRLGGLFIAAVGWIALIGLAAIFGHAGWKTGDVTTGPFVLTVVGFGLLTVGGWLGGSIVFVHGMRVLGLVDEPPERAVAPVASRSTSAGRCAPRSRPAACRCASATGRSGRGDPRSTCSATSPLP